MVVNKYLKSIEITPELLEFLKSVQTKTGSTKTKNSLINLGIGQLLSLDKPMIRLNLYHFHILVMTTKSQEHFLAKLDNSFFDEISVFKKKIFVELYYGKSKSPNKSHDTLTPTIFGYNCSNKKIGLVAKKKIIRLFNSFGVVISELKEKNEKSVTTFTFE